MYWHEESSSKTKSAEIDVKLLESKYQEKKSIQKAATNSKQQLKEIIERRGITQTKKLLKHYQMLGRDLI